MERKVTLNQPACTPGAALSMLANPLDLGPPCRPGRPKPALSLTLSCDTAAAAAELHLQLQQAAGQRSAAGLPAPRDLGAAIPLPAGGTAMHGTSVQERPGRAGVAAAARADLLLSQQEDEEAGQRGSPACSTHEAHAAAIVAATEDPRCATAAGVAAGDACGKHLVQAGLLCCSPQRFVLPPVQRTQSAHLNAAWRIWSCLLSLLSWRAQPAATAAAALLAARRRQATMKRPQAAAQLQLSSRRRRQKQTRQQRQLVQLQCSAG